MAKKSAAAAAIAQPIAQPENDGAVAPWPVIDRYPIVVGPGLSLSYISAIFKLSLIGYRQQYVDLLDELLEKDLHAFSVLSKRILGVAGGRLELLPAKVEGQEKLASEICKACREMLANLPAMEQTLAELSWASYYAIVGQEVHWQRDGGGWFPERLSLVHSRRLAYPVSGSWDLYVWDQGQVLPTQAYGVMPTNGVFGARVADYPGKFVIHAPQIRGNYPTRNGLGRQLAYWLALKLIATRGAPQYLERFAKPWPEATYSTGQGGGQGPGRPASTEDIATAKAALSAMGAGSLSSWVHPDTVKMDLRTPDNGGQSKLTFPDWIDICNAEISKAVIGGTLTTEVSTAGGNRALGETQKKGETGLLKYDGKMLASTIRRDLITWMVRLNFPSAPLSLVPRVILYIEDAPDPLTLIEKAAKAAASGIPVDADAVAAEANVPVIETGDTKARRMFPIMASKTPEAFDEDLAARAEALRPAAPAQPAAPPPNDNTPTPEGEPAPNDEQSSLDDEDS
jgi:phage gp29-like protein